jgi:prefoldin subunit 5
MEKNTVLLDIERYNELYNLEKKIKEGKRLVIEIDSGSRIHEYKYYYTDEEIAKELRDHCEKLEKENEKLGEKIEEAERKIPETEQQLTVEYLKQMNYWQFKKWKAGK